jgi:RNA polymerase sigma-54 factor
MKNKLSINLDIKPQQKLIITPQMKLSLNILQMNMIDVVKEINSIMESNPTLEELEKYNNLDWSTNDKSIIDEKKVDQKKITESFEDVDFFNTKIKNDDEVNYENFIAQPLTLQEHLLFQLRITGLDDLSKTIGEYIIGNLEQDGYFRLDINNVAEELNVEVDKVLEILKTIQTFDPAGIASRNLTECIIIQLNDMQIAKVIIEDIEDIIITIGNGDIDNIQKILHDRKYSKDYIDYLIDILKKIDPKPGLKYSENTTYIYPDVYIQEINGEFNIFVNERDIPTLRISNYYLMMLKKDNLDNETKEYLLEKIKNAEWVIKSLALRKQSILKVTEAIVEYQKDFFLMGYDYLKPMKLKDIAKKTGLHESTISRVTSGKYAHTKYGIIELKILFKKGYDTTDGALSVDKIKKLIRSIINEEPINNPYSDKKISDILMESGIQIARRTVSKYREEMNIPSKILRKRREK